MTHDETRESVREEYESLIADQSLDGFYRNYGDVNPAPHGGIWIAYDVDRRAWDVLITTPRPGVGFDVEYEPNIQHVLRAEIDFRDVVAEDGSWADDFERVPTVYHRGHDEPIGAVVDRQLTGYVAHEAREWGVPTPRRGQPVEEDSYGAILDRFGISPRDEP
jgi:hypothetical protein